MADGQKLQVQLHGEDPGMWTEGNEILKQLRAELEDEEAI